MIRCLILTFLILFANQCYVTHAYKPVVLIHGIMTGAPSMTLIQREIKKAHPGTIVYNTDRFSGWSSLENAWHQVDQLGQDLMEISRRHPEGIHLLGYSQGGLLARAILESFEDLNVKNFISLSSPQAGQFGTAFLHLIFPDLAAKTAYNLFYSYVGQHTSVGNYWNDPNQQFLYYNFSSFLPYVNNEIKSFNSSRFRENFLKVEQVILIGGPDDGVITPWQSSHFGYFGDDGEVVPFYMRKIYTNDDIGLKTLFKEGRLKVLTYPNVHHFEWHTDVSVIQESIIPHLD